MPTPYVGFSFYTLKRMPSVHAGDLIICHHCGKEHEVTELKATEGEKVNGLSVLEFAPYSSFAVDGIFTMQFVKCGDQSFMVGVCGKRVDGVKADMSGSVEL